MKEENIMILEEQLAIDYDCTVEEVRSDKNVFRLTKVNENARPISDSEVFLKVAVYREKLLVMADEKILDWFKNDLGQYDGVWLSEPRRVLPGLPNLSR